MNNPLFLNAVLLGGSTSEKVAAARATSFDQIELWRQDVESVPKGPGAVQDLLTGDNINLTYYQVVLDFDGAPGDRRAVKRAQATSILDQAVQVGTSTLLAPASTDRGCDPARIDEDMR